VQDGTITITYGNEANTQLTSTGAVLTLKPMVSLNSDVIWLCGWYDGAAIAGMTDPASGPSAGTPGAAGTDVEPKYLPQTCRAA